tara:strand:- start:2793 stop:2930 length:138 start_codon:yes stop_codon:yes gene_type:complete
MSIQEFEFLEFFSPDYWAEEYAEILEHFKEDYQEDYQDDYDLFVC